MAPESSSSPDDSFFNDLSRQPSDSSKGEKNTETVGDNENQPRAKRIACVLCRKRKLRCDGARPKCGTCSRLSHDCGYDEVRKKSGPKRGYVKLLEARLQHVETMLKTTDGQPATNGSFDSHNKSLANTNSSNAPYNPDASGDGGPLMTGLGGLPPVQDRSSNFTEMISIGTEEALPPQDVIDELHDIYFRQCHPSIPMIHQPRYLAAMNLIPGMRPPVCLRYIMWCLAASVSDKYHNLTDEFYHRARKYAELDEMKGHGESILTVGHCQTWLLLAWYEFKLMYFPRAWQDTGRAGSLALMMGLYRIDGSGLDVKQCLPPPKDWTEREERRRTFWMCFCADRYASIGTGWALRLDERDIMTLLPASDDAYLKSQPEPAISLEQAFSLAGSTNISAISSVIIIACLLGRNLTHLHRPTPHDNEEDLNGEFWQRHRQLESLLANICLALPDHLRIPGGLPDPNVIFMNMMLHTSVICLHQAAIYKADRNRLPQNIISESRARCVTGASEITRIMKMMSHIDLGTLNPFLAFCLYVAARVFVQYLKWRPTDQSMIASLQFLGTAMHILKRKNPLTESFLAQLEVDLEGTGIVIGPQTRNPWTERQRQQNQKNQKAMPGIIPTEVAVSAPEKCTSIFEITETQTTVNPDPSVFHAPNMNPQNFGLNGQINIDMDNSFNLSAGSPSAFQLPNRTKSSPFRGPVLAMAEGMGIGADNANTPSSTDMDYSGTGSSSSRSRNPSFKGNSPASFTPPSANDDQSQTTTHSMHGNSKNSPRTMDGSSALPTPNMASAADVMFFGVPDPTFNGFAGGQMFGNSYMNDGSSGMTPGWDMGNVDVSTTTGLTPMADWTETGHTWNMQASSGFQEERNG
ncbi:hypothetical protein BT63DRAFT_426889 [Microthyrium microscopicum]|uniref:Zn(2)-C6 fungal-type domain-containing protein n=1 Tax=Microthyrium microscopicum TaxID=703497 RepID=A0A6A6UAW6_9PEZI|nr:hypothetical protein BT63DRAFT_426889 [Microthyrium microscopicum]